MDPSEEMDEVHEDEIEESDITAEQEHGDEHDERGIGQFFVAADPFLLRFPRPGSFLQLHFYFVKEGFCFRDHVKMSMF